MRAGFHPRSGLPMVSLRLSLLLSMRIMPHEYRTCFENAPSA